MQSIDGNTVTTHATQISAYPTIIIVLAYSVLLITMLKASTKFKYFSRLGYIMIKCDFCDNEKYVERLNNKGVLENYCVNCINKIRSNK